MPEVIVRSDGLEDRAQGNESELVGVHGKERKGVFGSRAAFHGLLLAADRLREKRQGGVEKRVSGLGLGQG